MRSQKWPFGNRAGLAAGVLATTLVLAGGLPAAAQASLVRVDVSPLGRSLEGQVLARCLPQAAASALAGRVNAPVLVRVTAISLSGDDFSVGGRGRTFERGQANDYIEGEAIIGGRRVPMLSVVPVQYYGINAQQAAVRRAEALCTTFASWLPWYLR
jgi:hypothetical protein